MAIANTTIQLKKSLVSGNTPSTLASGELAINAADDKIFFAKPGGAISYITNQQSFATVNANSSLVLASSGTDTLTLIPGNNISISACTSTKTITINSTATGGGGSSDTSKMYNFRQNTAPSTANNTGDLWTNTDTGVVYENFGNTSNPIWAEFGPTGLTNNTSPGIISALSVSAEAVYVNSLNLLTYTQAAFDTANSSSSGVVYLQGALNQTNTNIISANTQLKAYTDGRISYVSGVDNTQNTNIQSAWNIANTALSNTGGTITGNLIVSGNTTINKQLFINYTPPSTTNSAIEITAANTKGGNGYADVLYFRNTSGGATYPNKTLRLNNLGNLEIIDSNYGNTIFILADSGDLTLKGNLITSNRPAFRVYGANTTGPLSTTQNGTGQLNYNNWALDYNQGGYLNYTSGTFTAPVAGLYQINMNVRNAGNASYSQLICYKNSNIVMICIEFAGSSTMNHTGGSTVAKLAAGDTLIIKVAAGTITFDGNDNWSVAYIG